MADRIGFLGPLGTYSHQACVNFFGEPSHQVIFNPQNTIKDCFESLLGSKVDWAVVPFENSTNGSVAFTLDLFRDYAMLQHVHCEIFVVGETCVKVQHVLMSHCKSIKNIDKIYSHPQAWGQCTDWLLSNLPGIERISVDSTSKAAEYASKDPNACAIGSLKAAQVFNLPILNPSVNDSYTNTTRFLVLSRNDSSQPPDFDLNDKFKTLCCFTVASHDDPGALSTCLEIFKSYDLNMTFLQTRPTRAGNWTYIFFVEFQGHSRMPHVQQALNTLRESSSMCRIWGSYLDAQRI